jgi:hypothetical protein
MQMLSVFGEKVGDPTGIKFRLFYRFLTLNEKEAEWTAHDVATPSISKTELASKNESKSKLQFPNVFDPVAPRAKIRGLLERNVEIVEDLEPDALNQSSDLLLHNYTCASTLERQ